MSTQFQPSTLCWYDDNGINLPMISDHARNQFYQRILSKSVKNKTCIDVGFGTGLLSLMALEQGAEKIIAFETNAERYHLGLDIIEKLKLKNLIDLRNERYCSTYFKDQTCVIIQEIVGHNLWNEGLRFIIDKDQVLVPGDFYCEYYCCPIDENIYQQFINHHTDSSKINLGINLNNFNFLKLIYEYQIKEQNVINLNDEKIIKDIYKDLLSKGSLIGKYCVLTNQKKLLINEATVEYNLDCDQIGYIDVPLTINLKFDCSIILAKYFIGHNEDLLVISPSEDNPTSHWAVPTPVCVISDLENSFIARTYLDDGSVRVYPKK